MTEETKEEIENRVLEDLQYILNYKPITPKAQSAEFFSKMKIIKPIAVNAYPNIYSDLVQRFDEARTHRIRVKHL